MSKQTIKNKAEAILSEKTNKIVASNIKKDVTIFDVTGSYEGIDTSDANATASDIVVNTSAYVKGVKVRGSLSDFRNHSSSVRLNENLMTVTDDTSHGKISAISQLSTAGCSPDNVAINTITKMVADVPYSKITQAINLTPGDLKQGVIKLGVTGTADISGEDYRDGTLDALVIDNIEDFSGTVLRVESHPNADYFSDKTILISKDTDIQVNIEFPDIINKFNITPDNLRQGYTLFDVEGEFTGEASNSSITFIKPGDIITIDLAEIADAMEDGIPDEYMMDLVQYRGGSSFNYGLKLATTVDPDDYYNGRGIGLVIDAGEGIVYMRGSMWNNGTGAIINCFNVPLSLNSRTLPPSAIYVRDLIGLLRVMNNTGQSGKVQITYPSDCPRMVIFKNNKIQLSLEAASDKYEPFTFDILNHPAITVTPANP